VALTFIEPMLGAKISSVCSMSSLLILKFGIILPSTYLIKSSVLACFLALLSNRISRFNAIYCVDQYGPDIVCHF